MIWASKPTSGLRIYRKRDLPKAFRISETEKFAFFGKVKRIHSRQETVYFRCTPKLLTFPRPYLNRTKRSDKWKETTPKVRQIFGQRDGLSLHFSIQVRRWRDSKNANNFLVNRKERYCKILPALRSLKIARKL